MIKLGEKQELIIVRQVSFGVYLSDPKEYKKDGEEAQRVLLPLKQIPEGKSAGDSLEVFVYRDSMDRLIASTRMPYLFLHQTGILKVKEIARIGAFLDWGMEKDLLLPFAEQTRKVQAGEEVLVSVYIDKSDRLCATMNVYPYLRTDSPYGKEDRVKGTVYEISDNFGAFVAVDGQFSGLISRKELYGKIAIGDHVDARVIHVKGDGKLDLSIREKAWIQIETDAVKVMELIESHNGVLPFNDKASPEIIRQETQMSKNEFKRAVGHLLKEGRIQIGESTIQKRFTIS